MLNESAITRLRRKAPWLRLVAPLDESPNTNASASAPNPVPDRGPIAPTVNLGAVNLNEIAPPEMLKMRRNAPYDFGTDSRGHLRDKPKSGIGHRLLAGLKVAAQIAPQVLAQGGSPAQGIGAGLAGIITGAADPSMPAKLRRRRSLAEDALVMEQDQRWRNEESLINARNAEAQARLMPDEPRVNFGWIPDPNNPEGADIYAPLTPGLTRSVRKPTPKEKEFNIGPGQERVAIGSDGKPKVVYSRPDRPKTEAADKGEETRELKRVAAQSELQQLIADEQAAGAEKNRAYDYLAQLKANGASAEDVRQAASEAARADTFYKSFGAKKVAARRRAQENTPIRKANGVSEQAIREAAEAKGLDPDRAVQRARKRGLL